MHSVADARHGPRERHPELVAFLEPGDGVRQSHGYPWGTRPPRVGSEDRSGASARRFSYLRRAVKIRLRGRVHDCMRAPGALRCSTPRAAATTCRRARNTARGFPSVCIVTCNRSRLGLRAVVCTMAALPETPPPAPPRSGEGRGSGGKVIVDRRDWIPSPPRCGEGPGVGFPGGQPSRDRI